MEWIKCTDRLPNCNNKWGTSPIVLVCDAWGRRGFGIYQNGTMLNSEGWFSGTDSVRIDYWCYLPEAPEDVRKE